MLTALMPYLEVWHPLEKPVDVRQPGRVVLQQPTVAVEDRLFEGDWKINLIYFLSLFVTCCSFWMFPTCSHILTAASMDPGTVGLGRSLAAWVMVRWAESMAGIT